MQLADGIEGERVKGRGGSKEGGLGHRLADGLRARAQRFYSFVIPLFSRESGQGVLFVALRRGDREKQT